MMLTKYYRHLSSLRKPALAAVIFAGSFQKTWSQDNMTAGEILKAGMKATNANNHENAIYFFYEYIEVVEYSSAPRVVIICQDIRYRLAKILIKEQRTKEAADVLSDYINTPLMGHPHQAMKMLATFFYETEQWQECANLVTYALEFDENPMANFDTNTEEERYSEIDISQDAAYTPEEISHLKKTRAEALFKAPNDTTNPVKSETVWNQAEAKAKAIRELRASEGLINLFGNELLNADEEMISTHTLADKMVGIYFSADKSTSTQVFFTPKLVKFHNEITKSKKPFEIVFVSADRDQNSMHAYMIKVAMPWLALPYESSKKKELAQKYGVKSIPCLVIVDSNGDLITKDGQGDVANKKTNAFETWIKK